MEFTAIHYSPALRNVSTPVPLPRLPHCIARAATLFSSRRPHMLPLLSRPSKSRIKAAVTDLDTSLMVKNKAMEVAQELKGTSIFLIGMQCTMKSELGKVLANALRYYFFDSDSLVVEAAGGETAAKAYKQRDAEGFRDSETEVLKQLSSMGRLVICAGDGAVQSSINLAFLRHGISVWVDVPLDIIAKDAIESEGKYPISDEIATSDTSEVLDELIKVYQHSKDGYATADATISVQKVAAQLGLYELEAVTSENMAIEVLKEIEKLTRVKKLMAEAARPF